VNTVRWLVAAREEAEAAARWYEDRRAGLGADFVAEIEGAVDAVLQAPSTFGVVMDEPRVRRVLLLRFPFAVVFVQREAEVVVVAVAHLRRRPAYWRSRVR